jgi:8-oxo-dGTP diphosphatase
MRIKERWFVLVQVAYDLIMKLNPRKLAAHAVITDEAGRVLVLRNRYAGRWLLPGGGVERREHLDAALARECREELGVTVAVGPLTGLYYHAFNSTYVGVFRCHITGGTLRLSHEHSEYRWLPVAELPPRLREMAADALAYRGQAVCRTIL